MSHASRLNTKDRALIRIVDSALAEAARRSGPWLVCRPGCHECCLGPFKITQLDARRLRTGLAELDRTDRARADRVRLRAVEAAARVRDDFPGDPATGLLAEGAEAEARFDALAPDDPCPALDPETKTCDLYDWRPLTCRTFGPPVRCDFTTFAVCQLCYHGATDEEIAACSVEIDPGGLEARLLDELGQSSGSDGMTIVAFALR